VSVAVAAPPDRRRNSLKLMNIEVERIGRASVIRLSGRLDVYTSPDLRKAAIALYGKHACKTLLIDLAGVSYSDTAGLATLLEILLSAKEHGATLTLSGLNEEVEYLIDINGLTRFFTIESGPTEVTRL
jgi:anti-sigma B factor antagonist